MIHRYVTSNPFPISVHYKFQSLDEEREFVMQYFEQSMTQLHYV